MAPLERVQPTDSSGATSEEIAALRRRHEARFREATRQGFFDGAKVAECFEELDDESARLGLDPDRFLLQLHWQQIAAAVPAWHASLNAHEQRMRQLAARMAPEQRSALRRELERLDREHGYRTQLVTVRELHADLTGGKVRDFLGTQASVTPMHRPLAAARARRSRHSSSSSPTSGTDPGDEDPARSPLAAVILLPRRRPTLYEFGCLSPEERGEHDGGPDAALHHFRPDLDGPARLAEFLALPEDLQSAYDRDLEREIEVSRR